MLEIKISDFFLRIFLLYLTNIILHALNTTRYFSSKIFEYLNSFMKRIRLFKVLGISYFRLAEVLHFKNLCIQDTKKAFL